MTQFQNILLTGTGLADLQTTLINNWIGPVFFIILAGVSITFLVQREIRKLITFVLIAGIAGALIFFGSSLFGKSGTMSGAVNNVAGKVNTVNPASALDLFIE